jgi:hypothetical protein
MADVGLDRLLGEVERLADLTIHEAVGDKLEDLGLALGRFLLEPPHGRLERHHLATLGGRLSAAPGGGFVEAPGVIEIPGQYLFAFCSVHVESIGGGTPIGRP